MNCYYGLKDSNHRIKIGGLIVMDYPFQDSIKRNKDKISQGNAELNRNMEEEDIIDNSKQEVGE